jgi:hypothetical protein
MKFEALKNTGTNHLLILKTRRSETDIGVAKSSYRCWGPETLLLWSTKETLEGLEPNSWSGSGGDV